MHEKGYNLQVYSWRAQFFSLGTEEFRPSSSTAEALNFALLPHSSLLPVQILFPPPPPRYHFWQGGEFILDSVILCLGLYLIFPGAKT